jgi:hypothetical protein
MNKSYLKKHSLTYATAEGNFQVISLVDLCDWLKRRLNQSLDYDGHQKYLAVKELLLEAQESLITQQQTENASP